MYVYFLLSNVSNYRNVGRNVRVYSREGGCDKITAVGAIYVKISS